VRPVAVQEFETFLTPHVAARGYLITYDFVLVRFLAERLGVDLHLEPVTPAPIDPHAAVRYATFLAAHREFTSSPEVERFTMLLDDYLFAGVVDARFLKEHVTRNPEGLAEKQQVELSLAAQGFVQFVQILGDFFLQLDDQQQRLFGCAYAYWLSHFFGQRRRTSGYVQVDTSFEGLTPDPWILPSGLDPPAREAEQKRFIQRIDTLQQVWARTRALIESLDTPARNR
jgi:hypothetical protein